MMAPGSAYCGTIKGISRLTIGPGLTKREGDDAEKINPGGWRMGVLVGEGTTKTGPQSARRLACEKRLGKTTTLWALRAWPVLEGLHWKRKAGLDPGPRAEQGSIHPAPAAFSDAGMTRATCVVLCCTSLFFLFFSFSATFPLPFPPTFVALRVCSLGASQTV